MTTKKLENDIFENTITYARTDDDGQLVSYHIEPKDGYVIHTKFYDSIDEETGEETKGYTPSYILLRGDYDFKTNPFDIYAVAREEADSTV